MQKSYNKKCFEMFYQYVQLELAQGFLASVYPNYKVYFYVPLLSVYNVVYKFCVTNFILPRCYQKKIWDRHCRYTLYHIWQTNGYIFLKLRNLWFSSRINWEE